MRGMDDFPGAAEESRRPEREPAASPHLAPEPAPPPPPRRRSALRVGLGAVAAGAIVIGLVLWGVAPRSAPVTLAGAEGGRVLDPIRPRSDARSGEQVAPFSGFAVSVETDPPGAVVTIGGVPRGESPVLAGLDCSPGDKVEITAEKGGYAVARTATTCRADALVKLNVRLRR